jgi:DNA methylase
VQICPPAGTVLNPFAGAGSTGVAAILEGRNFVGIDARKRRRPDREPGRCLADEVLGTVRSVSISSSRCVAHGTRSSWRCAGGFPSPGTRVSWRLPRDDDTHAVGR